MGQEIDHSHFTAQEYQHFAEHLAEETQQLTSLLADGQFSDRGLCGGFEVEAWLVDKQWHPAPENARFLSAFNNPLATAELAQFNIELNNQPLALKADCFQRFESEMDAVFRSADRVAESMDLRILLCGILPTLKPEHCSVENMSAMKRYRALNQTILKLRNHQPIALDIEGRDHLRLLHHSVMLEAATTSFQVHLQVPWQQAHHYYNAAIMASAPVMAVSANAPFLFGKQLWHESRIPLFEQAVDTGAGAQRVSFGSGYAEQSIAECFEENQRDFAVLLPIIFGEQQRFRHLRLHNGVIWRWNRPLVGFDDDGTPHIRIEHRVMPAGPTVKDMLANAAFFYGLAETYKQRLVEHPESRVPFDRVQHHFYSAARDGLDARFIIDGHHHKQSGHGQMRSCEQQFHECWLPDAEAGLQAIGIDASAITAYLGIIAERVQRRQTGALWQIAHFRRHRDVYRLTQDYLHHQHSHRPVHEWGLN